MANIWWKYSKRTECFCVNGCQNWSKACKKLPTATKGLGTKKKKIIHISFFQIHLYLYFPLYFIYSHLPSFLLTNSIILQKIFSLLFSFSHFPLIDAFVSRLRFLVLTFYRWFLYFIRSTKTFKKISSSWLRSLIFY